MALVNLYKSKIHRATVTDANLNYVGSVTIDEELMKAADMLPHERVQVLNHANGERFESYVIVGEPGSGTICLNGPAARLGHVGDKVTLITYAWVTPDEARDWQPTVVRVDDSNRVADVVKGTMVERAGEP
ncbi:MAG: aspartate 1-decarboxylase [Armatimonadota bacterium]|nr:MAG: aspartate 1-decarboxylase [Armatimonadota bacterium]